MKNNNFVEVCIYEVKPDKTVEFEALVEMVAEHHRQFSGVVDVRYIKRTHRQQDFKGAKEGEPPIKLTRIPKQVTYVLYWELDGPETHGLATKSGLRRFFKEFNRYLMKPPKIILGERIE